MKLELVPPAGSPGPAIVCQQPVSVGVPFARGACPNPDALSLRAIDGTVRGLQVRPLERWPDDSIRWALLSFQSDGASPGYWLGDNGHGTPDIEAVRVTAAMGGMTVDTGPAVFRIAVNGTFPFDDVTTHGRSVVDPARSGLLVRDQHGQPCRVKITGLSMNEAGPLRAVIEYHGQILRRGRVLLNFEARVEFFAGSTAVRIELTVHNPRAAQHRGGIWELGDAGSILIKSLELAFALHSSGPAAVTCSAEVSAPARTLQQPLELYQDSSGGQQWNSRNHVNRDGRVPNSFSGYRLQSGEERTDGARATPYIALDHQSTHVAVAMQHFWQNFPKGIEARDNALVVQLFPGQYGDVHEIQGGEQKTHRFVAAFGRDALADRLAEWGRSPAVPHAPVAQYCDNAVPYLHPADGAGDMAAYERLVASAIEGSDSFEQKREIIDEYGWRNFGDIYADHEAAFANGPIISHYNNQYDAVAGSAHQFMRTGDVRWWTVMDELAAHVTDIDIYHTTLDKAAYNGGLFWHTFHYVEAGRSTHRSYPSGDNICGGGPAAEHSYASGLRLHYLLTGDPRSKAAAIGLARWIVAMDDGRNTILRWISTAPTGLASSTASALYHGPGRGAGHAIITLLEGHRLAQDDVFLLKAEELIRRCIHPDDDIEALELLDAERRWSYTAFLEALARYLDYKAERGDLDEMYTYARSSLLLYARWMARHEYPYLDKPEILEYPTETWAAQDMRKAEVFLLASRHTSAEEQERFLERARFFFRYSVLALQEMPTRTVARPVVLLLSHGFMYGHFLAKRAEPAPLPHQSSGEFGRPAAFVPQKARAVEILKMIPRTPTIVARFILTSLT